MWDEVAKGARQKYTNPSICQAKRLIGGVIRSKKGMPAPNSVFNRKSGAPQRLGFDGSR